MAEQKDSDIFNETVSINNRRYLGNKYKLLPFISEVIEKECMDDISSFADIFAGTGSVSTLFYNKEIITNDLLYSNYISNLAWFGALKYDYNKIVEYIKEYNNINSNQENYVSINFSNTYFSRKDCLKIGYIREDIENKYNANLINERERAILITSLIYAMDRIAHTCGHYDAYIKDGNYQNSLELYIPLVNNNNNIHNKNYNLDANELVKNIYADLIYIDPPYNSRQYSGAYHLLENIAMWQKPAVYGTAKKMDRKNIQSKYCTRQAGEVFRDLINNISARYILFSYNNMSSKGSDRSNARISDDDIVEILQSKGKLKIFSTDFKAFSTGKSKINDHKERLFFCECIK